MVRGRNCNSIVKTIELAPLMRLSRLAGGTGIEALEASVELQPSSMIIEPTSDNPDVASTMDRTSIDEGLTIANEPALKAAPKLVQLKGLPVGVLSCTAFSAALDVGVLHEMAKKQIVVIVPSSSEGYLSSPLFEGL